MKTVPAILVSIVAAGSLFAAIPTSASAPVTKSQTLVAEHVRLEMQLIHLQSDLHFSTQHPQVLTLRHHISDLERQESPRVARMVRHELASQLQLEQEELEAKYMLKQRTDTEQNPEMVALRSQITSLENFRHQIERA